MSSHQAGRLHADKSCIVLSNLSNEMTFFPRVMKICVVAKHSSLRVRIMPTFAHNIKKGIYT